MCEPLSIVTGILGAAGLAGSMYKGHQEQKAMKRAAELASQQAPQATSYAVESATQNMEMAAPEAPLATPTFGQKAAEDMAKDSSNETVKRNKKGRAALRIDKNPVTGAGTASVANGTVVPRG